MKFYTPFYCTLYCNTFTVDLRNIQIARQGIKPCGKGNDKKLVSVNAKKKTRGYVPQYTSCAGLNRFSSICERDGNKETTI